MHVAQHPIQSKLQRNLPILVGTLLFYGIWKTLVSIETAALSTIFLLCTVTLLGHRACCRTSKLLGDPNLNILQYLWPVKLALTIFLLFAGWVTDLNPSSPNWGGDPIRYYYDAFATANNNWIPMFTWDGYTFSEGLGANYTGIIYYYGVIFYIFGHNPLIPALINSFVTLFGTLFLIRCVYNFTPIRTKLDWRIAYLLLIPEVVWYDVMTGREALMAVLIMVATLASGRYLVGLGRATLLNTLVMVGVTSVGILAVRTSMAIPVVASIGLMVVLLRSRNNINPLSKSLLIALGMAALVAGPIVQEILGGNEIDYLKVLDSLQAPSDSSTSEMGWSDQSIGLLLVPNGLLQTIAFIPPRMILYLAAPLPNVNLDLFQLFDGTYRPWSNLITVITATLMLLGFPYVLAGSGLAWRFRKAYPAMMIIPIAFWMNFVAVAGGNFIIHERYRAMFILLLFACAWIGYTHCSSRSVFRWAVSWFCLLGTGAIFYFIYKFF
jgi:hypothetical protein